MFSLPKKNVYGLTAVFELALRFGESTPFQGNEIAQKYNIPFNYLEQLLIQLKTQGIVESVLGSSGGYRLVSPPEKISVLSVLIALDGELEIYQGGESISRLAPFWSEIEITLQGVLNISLRELVEKMTIASCLADYSI
jgi:Rrf2 family protein